MKTPYALLAATFLLMFSTGNVVAQGDNPLPSITSIGQSSTINCTSPSRTIGVSIYPWVSGFVYQWNTGETDSVLSAHPSVTTTYFLQVSNPDLGINVIKGFEIRVENDPIQSDDAHFFVDKHTCLGSDLEIEPIAFGGYPPFMYSWPDGSPSSSVTVNPSADETYLVTVSDICGSEKVAKVYVHVEQHDPIVAPQPEEITFNCEGEEVLLSPKMKQVSGGVGHGYTFQFEGADINKPIEVGTEPDKLYAYSVTDACAHNVSTSKITLIQEPITLPTPTDMEVCKGQTVDVVHEEESRFYFWDGESMKTAHEMQIDDRTEINLNYIDGCGDNHNLKRLVTVSEVESAFEYDVHEYTEEIDLIAEIEEDNESYIWRINGEEVASGAYANVSLGAGSSNTVELEVQNKNGCIARTSKTITMRDNFSAASAFSPNNDGRNDVFTLVFDEEFEHFNVQIFDRWGQLIFESNDQYFTWDGGQQNAGQLNTYVYRIKGTTISGQSIDKSNTLTVVN